MVEQKIDFRKIRDFGENMNDTLLFIRQNFLPLIKSFFAICAVFMLAQAIFNGMYQSRSMAFFLEIFGGRRNSPRPFRQVFNIEYLMVLVTTLLVLVSMHVALGAYIKYYVQNNGEHPSIENVWQIFKRYFFKVLVYIIPVYILMIVGFIFCVLPGVYLWVVFVPFTITVIVEETNFSDTFARCFDLIRDNFWASFAIYFISYIIYSVSGLLIGGVISAVIGLAAYLTTDDLTTTSGIASSFLNIFSFCFYIIFFVSAALHYFNLAERRDGTGILNRIDNIGKNKNNFDNIEEEY